MTSKLIDTHNRIHKDLRISITIDAISVALIACPKKAWNGLPEKTF